MRRPGRGREACCARAASRRAARGTAHHQLSLFLSGGAMWPGTHKIIGMLMKNKLLHHECKKCAPSTHLVAPGGWCARSATRKAVAPVEA